eukprot:CAMPEP_0202385454 /NCGR_PEP_ID=MMETSP1127-20130417/60939_1 /ASSEMBLY_ACC=CAM_ASM_000462 /TAXON_ID=3047 /ORGANISM="Dunaliella tertiolecta, Strain CCMP1320" /LENGTH=353 /DNA_ID=CAMNT_0048985623 /DNA_START=59 /DNA_END=1120 /DNA_ORIENTATION=+
MAELGRALQEVTGLSAQTMKLLGAKMFKGALVLAHVPPEDTADKFGLQTGAKVMLLGSRQSEVEALQHAKAAEPRLRMAGFEHEALMAAQRRRTARPVAPPTGTPFTFHDYQVLPERPGVFPPPKEALKLLHRLASDSGIIHIMKDNQFTVGSLREMPPEGLVGISETCVLGYNVNRGQEIHLRLRTDDGKGFRKYRSILQTLCHELTHNVHGPHDNSFKALCSKLNQDVNNVNARLSQGGQRAVLHGGDLPKDEEEDLANEEREQHAAMAATQASSGKTLRQLAAQRQQSATPSAQQQATVPAADGADGTQKASGDEAGAEREEDLGDVAFVYEHKHAGTEELEKKQRALEQ